MWEQYRKTVWGMQVLIAVVTCGVLAWSHVFGMAALFFVTMQIAAVVGAMWGMRLKDKVERAVTLPARRS
jgi:hypothetical protein